MGLEIPRDSVSSSTNKRHDIITLHDAALAVPELVLTPLAQCGEKTRKTLSRSTMHAVRDVVHDICSPGTNEVALVHAHSQSVLVY